MEDKKISELNLLGAASSEDLIPIDDIDQNETKAIRKDALLASPGPVGSTAPSIGKFTTLQVTSGATINEFSTDGTLAGDSNSALPTEQAVKTYVDSQISGVDEHNELLNIQGGDSTAGEFYHLTQEIYDGLFSGSPLIGLGSQAETNLIVDYGINEVTIDISGTETLRVDSTGMTLVLGTSIDEFSTDETLSGNSDDAVPTEKAVKTYVDNQVVAAVIVGNEDLSSGDTTASITFVVAQSDINYGVAWSLVNTTNFPPSIYAGTIYDKTTNGFSVIFSGPMDTDNYVLSWIVTR